MVVRPRVRRDSCRIRWLGFRSIRRKRRRGSKREKLLRALVERLHAACDIQLREDAWKSSLATSQVHNYSGTERSSNGGTL